MFFCKFHHTSAFRIWKKIFQCLFLKDSIHFLSSRIERWRNENGTEPLFSDFVENNYHEIESQRPRVSSEASSEECKLDARCTFLPRQTKIWCRIFFLFRTLTHSFPHVVPHKHTHTHLHTHKQTRTLTRTRTHTHMSELSHPLTQAHTEPLTRTTNITFLA